MQEYTFQMLDSDKVSIFVYRWTPDKHVPVKGIVQIAHGMCETAKRYEELANTLTQHGFIVYGNDHRGHGQTGIAQGMLGDGGPDVFHWMVKDVAELAEYIHEEQPGIPLYLLGHSMGSFITQKIMYSHPELFDGYILSGTNGKRGLLAFGKRLAMLQAGLQGQEHRSLLLNAIIFGGYNRAFRPVETPFDWLSKDKEEVRKFVEDPLCGAICTARFFRSFFELLMEIHLPSYMNRIPKNKPVYIFSGERDPVGMNGKGVLSLVQTYRELHFTDLNYRLYPGGRHEMLHEVNRKEVSADLVDWLEHHV
ncbi:lysophospholipase [Neobacillus mesonae]|nr:lysophospholipase [Neobacillus mesonae]